MQPGSCGHHSAATECSRCQGLEVWKGLWGHPIISAPPCSRVCSAAAVGCEHRPLHVGPASNQEAGSPEGSGVLTWSLEGVRQRRRQRRRKLHFLPPGPGYPGFGPDEFTDAFLSPLDLVTSNPPCTRACVHALTHTHPGLPASLLSPGRSGSWTVFLFHFVFQHSCSSGAET